MEFRCDGKQGFVKIASLQPIRRRLTLTAEVHLGSCSLPGVGQPPAALCSRLSGTTELRGSDRGGSLWQRVGAQRSTAAQRSSVCFSQRLNLSPEVDLRKYAVRVGDSSRLRGWRGVSRGAENVLRTEESALEKQVSFAAEDSYFPRCGAFGGRQWLCAFSKCCPGSVRVRVPCAAADLLCSWPRWSGSSSLALFLLASLCNAWVLSCQHQLQILACGTAHWSVRGAADARVSYKIPLFFLHLQHVALQRICRIRASPIFVVFMCSSIQAEARWTLVVGKVHKIVIQWTFSADRSSVVLAHGQKRSVAEQESISSK